MPDIEDEAVMRPRRQLLMEIYSIRRRIHKLNHQVRSHTVEE